MKMLPFETVVTFASLHSRKQQLFL